jgi:hypothetical protein
LTAALFKTRSANGIFSQKRAGFFVNEEHDGAGQASKYQSAFL